MKQLRYILILMACLISGLQANAQRGGALEDGPKFIPGAIYEVRYWTNMARMGDSHVYIDTMIFFNNDRAVFEYSNNNCISYHCADNDALVYAQLPNLSREKEIFMGKKFMRKDYMVNVPFRGYDRGVYRVFVSDVDNKATGIGEYALVSREFGIIYRYNSDGEIYMLNRIDVWKDGILKDEIDLLPLQIDLGKTDIFTGFAE